MSRRLGLIIGVNHYQDAVFRPLQFAETDARALAQWLVNVRGGKWLPADLQLVLGNETTRELAESLIMQVCLNEARPGDLVLIYFAGHAFVDQMIGEGYLALTNTRYQHPNTALYLPSLVQQAVVRSRASQVILMLDCFQTGSVWNLRRTSSFDFKPLLGQTLLHNLQQTQGRLLYCSCRGNELAPEVGVKNVGRLLHTMILGLCGPAADDATGHITLQGLHTFLSGALDEQHLPQIFGYEQRQVVLAGDMPSFVSSFQTGTAVHGSPSVASTVASPLSQKQHTTVSRPLVEQTLQHTPGSITATTQMSPTTSGQLTLSVVERNRQQQCMTLVNQARQLIQAQNLSEASTIIDRVLQMAPDFIDALILKGQLIGASGRFQEAMTVVDQVMEIDPDNALAWSMRAVLLTNTGQLQEALPTIERSIALDPYNRESQTIKDTILSNLVRQQYREQSQKLAAFSSPKHGGPLSFFLGTAIQIFAMLIGAIGASLLVIGPHLPIIIAFLLESSALAILCVNAAQGAYLYGFARVLLTLVTSLIAVGITGGLYKFAYTWLTHRIIASPPLIVPVLFLGIWLALAAILPLLFASGGFIAGLIVHLRRKRVEQSSFQY